MDHAYRIRVQGIHQGSAVEFEVRVSRVPIANNVRFDNVSGIPSLKTPFIRNDLRLLLVDVLGGERAADAVLVEAESGRFSERELPVRPDPDYMKLLDKLGGGKLLAKS